MLALDLFESPSDDLLAMQAAKEACDKYASWLHKNNETVPLEEIPEIGFQKTHRGLYLWGIEAEKVGIDNPRLIIAIGWKPNYEGASAFATSGRDGDGNSVILLVMMKQNNPAEKTDLYIGMRWDDFIHEYIHVLDYDRGYLRHKAKQTSVYKNGSGKYYNSPIEFNAYYMQGLHVTLLKLQEYANPSPDIVKNYESKEAYIEMMTDHFKEMTFKRFQINFGRRFDHNWLSKLNEENKKRFMKRFYKLYQLVKTQWPDIEAIKQEASKE